MIQLKPCCHLSNFDLFGISPHLYFRGTNKKGSCFGVFLSFMLFLFTFFCFFYFGQSLYYRTNPKIAMSDSFVPYPDKFTIDPEIFPLLFEINDPNGAIYFTDPSMLTASITQLTFTLINGTQTLDTQTYPMEICTNSHFDKLDIDVQSYFTSKNLSNYFCIPQYLTNLTMQGSFDQAYYQDVQLSFSLCTNDPKCLPKDEILAKMSIGYVGLYFVDKIFQSGSYENPAKESPQEFVTNFVVNAQKSINVFYKNSYIVTDDGVVFSTNKTQKFVGYDGFQEYNFLTPQDEFFIIYLKIRQQEIIYSRIYSKLQEVLAQIGGFINIFWIFSKIINVFYARLLFIRDIVLDVFNVNSNESHLRGEVLTKTMSFSEKKPFSDEKKNVEIFQFPEKNREIFVKPPPKILNDEKIEDIHYSQERIEQISKSNSSQQKNPEPLQKITLGLLDYIHFYTGLFKSPEREKKKALLSKGLLVLKKNLDVKYIIQKFYEIEKLKFFLLNEEKLKNFHQIEKPKLVFIRNSKEKSGTVITKIMRKRVSLHDGSQETPRYCEVEAPFRKKTGRFVSSSFDKYKIKK